MPAGSSLVRHPGVHRYRSCARDHRLGDPTDNLGITVRIRHQRSTVDVQGPERQRLQVVALAGASCSTARKWVPRLTHERASFTLKPVPAGWKCSTTGDYTGLTKTGHCTTPKGGIVEWLPKLKK
jgi:hypothetical protein